MSIELICITCPIGCHLSVEKLDFGEITVAGNRCARGATYAKEETTAPKRVVTATCKILRPKDWQGDGLSFPRRVPVKTTAAFPKEQIGELLQILYALEVGLPVRQGQVIVQDALSTGIDVVATRSIGEL